MNTEEQLRKLLNKPSWTDQECQMVLDYLEKGEVGELAGLLKERFEAGMLKNMPEDQDRAARILSILHTRIHAPARTIPISRYRWWAAAAVFILATSTYLLFFSKQQSGLAKQETQKLLNTLKNDAAPGGNRATLTLNNGSTIVLDSAHIGTLAQQGNANVIKMDSGKLVYNILNEKPRTHPNEVQYNVLTTPMGGQFQLTLPDGSEVWLNAASSIKFPTAFRGKKRNVEITGEAYFEVSKDKSKPFHVKVNDMEVEVLGTHFNINSYSDEVAIKTTLLEGSVKVTKNMTPGVTLRPGQQAVQQENAKGFTVVSDANLDQVMAWKNGIFNFNKLSLQEVLRQLSRWYDVEVVYEGSITPKKFGGEAQRDLNLSEVLEGLQAIGVHFKIDGKKLIVMP